MREHLSLINYDETQIAISIPLSAVDESPAISGIMCVVLTNGSELRSLPSHGGPDRSTCRRASGRAPSERAGRALV